MAGLDDLSRGELADILRRLRQLETASPLQNASIGSNGLRVYDGGVITIQNGGLSVTGTASITGTLQADGTVAFTGTFTQSGPTTFTGDTKLNGPTHINGNTDVTGDFKVTGPTHLQGATDVKGTLSVEGVSTLKGDLNVTTGKINVGSALTIDPAVDGGGLSFSTGAKLSNSSGGIGLQLGGAVSGVTSFGAFMGTSGANILTSQADGIVGVTGKLQVGTLPTTTQAANVYVDANGNFFRKV